MINFNKKLSVFRVVGNFRKLDLNSNDDVTVYEISPEICNMTFYGSKESREFSDIVTSRFFRLKCEENLINSNPLSFIKFEECATYFNNRLIKDNMSVMSAVEKQRLMCYLDYFENERRSFSNSTTLVNTAFAPYKYLMATRILLTGDSGTASDKYIDVNSFKPLIFVFKDCECFMDEHLITYDNLEKLIYIIKHNNLGITCVFHFNNTYRHFRNLNRICDCNIECN